jgi:hypothetical protein
VFPLPENGLASIKHGEMPQRTYTPHANTR